MAATALSLKQRVVAKLRSLENDCKLCGRTRGRGARCACCDLNGIGELRKELEGCAQEDWSARGRKDAGCGKRRSEMTPRMRSGCDAVMSRMRVLEEMEYVEVAEVVCEVDRALVPAEVLRTLRRKGLVRRTGKTRYELAAVANCEVRATEGASQDGGVNRKR